MSTAPLTGFKLIDCARANGSKGIKTAASRCGYGEHVDAFENALQPAGEPFGIEIDGFDDLVSTPEDEDVGVVIAPESQDRLSTQ